MHRGCPPGPLAQSACLVANLGAGLPPPLAREFSDRNTPPCLDQHRPLVDNDWDPGPERNSTPSWGVLLQFHEEETNTSARRKHGGPISQGSSSNSSNNTRNRRPRRDNMRTNEPVVEVGFPCRTRPGPGHPAQSVLGHTSSLSSSMSPRTASSKKTQPIRMSDEVSLQLDRWVQASLVPWSSGACYIQARSDHMEKPMVSPPTKLTKYALHVSLFFFYLHGFWRPLRLCCAQRTEATLFLLALLFVVSSTAAAAARRPSLIATPVGG